MPDTLVVPTVVPPEVHELGAEDCGPKTVKVTTPAGADPPDRVADTAEDGIVVPAVPDDGADTASAGLAPAKPVNPLPTESTAAHWVAEMQDTLLIEFAPAIGARAAADGEAGSNVVSPPPPTAVHCETDGHATEAVLGNG